VDENWTCKICDFGLSQIQKTKQKIQDEDDAAGSVLWMAPEVLLKQQIDSKLDVYSFSLVLWEIQTRADLFAEFDDKETFTEAVAVRHVRPPLDGIHPCLQTIIVKAWDKEPQKRPTFEEILDMLQRCWITIFIPDYPLTQAFWDKNFKGKSKASWDQFVKRFSPLLGKKERSKLQLEIACLQKLVAEEEKEGEKFLSVERFGALLKWFGPIKSDKGDILDRIQSTMKCDWFFGGYSSDEAEAVLKLYKDKPGTFLVRLNMRGNNPIEKSPFTISRIDERGKIVHTRIQRKDSGLRISVGKGESQFKFSQESNRLDDFINQLKEKEPNLFRASCPGWPFQQLFKKPEICIYEGQDSDVEEEDVD
jgi:serine/threonine protein kinase